VWVVTYNLLYTFSAQLYINHSSSFSSKKGFSASALMLVVDGPSIRKAETGSDADNISGSMDGITDNPKRLRSED